MSDRVALVRGEDGKSRCWWAVSAPEYVSYHDQEWGRPVTDDDGRLVGVITEFALLAVTYDNRVKNHTVSQHMTRDIITVDIDDPISRVADLCIVHRVRRVPVMKDGRLVGIISRRDVLRALIESSTAICSA